MVIFRRLHAAALVQTYTVRPLFYGVAVGLVIMTSGIRFGSLAFASYYLRQPALSQTAPVHHTAKPAAGATQPVTATAVATTPASVPSTAAQTCSPDTSYTLPGSLDLSTAESGLSQQIDQPSSYQIHGSSTQQLYSQMAQCAPSLSGGSQVAEFASETGYNMTWQYNYAVTGDQQCALRDIKVGLHVNMVLPTWSPTSQTPSSFSANWQHFITSLRSHENGHVAIDSRYANQLTQDLQHLPASDCGTISASASNLIQDDLNRLNQANDQYDAATNHGATQGASLS